MSTLGILFSDIHSRGVAELTHLRTVASVPFGGRYRLVDFPLSNMVNSGIYKIGVITKSNYHSLIDHIKSGKDWDLSRKNGGAILLPPYGIAASAGPYQSRLDALKRIKKFIESSTEDYVVMADCDVILNIDYNEVIKFHESSGADITCVYKDTEIEASHSKHSTVYKVSDSGRICDILLTPELSGTYSVAQNSWVMTRKMLLYLISEANTHGLEHFNKDILLANVGNMKIMGYHHSSYSAHISSLSGYVKYNMDMICKEKRDALFAVPSRPVHTKVRDSAPTRYGNGAIVKNSLIADGCDINGYVENSILFEGVKIESGSRVTNCIVMQNTIIESSSSLSWIICDKNVIIKSGRTLSADKSYPLYITKGKMI